MYDDIYEELGLPPASVNNSRKIVREKIETWHRTQNDIVAGELEDMGVTVNSRTARRMAGTCTGWEGSDEWSLAKVF